MGNMSGVCRWRGRRTTAGRSVFGDGMNWEVMGFMTAVILINDGVLNNDGEGRKENMTIIVMRIERATNLFIKKHN